MKSDQEKSKEPRSLTLLLRAWSGGAEEARDLVFEEVYAELRSLASLYLKNERRARLSIQPTMLVNEAYLRLAHQNLPWRDRAHFFGVAAQAMRRILVDAARKRNARKRDSTLLIEAPTGPVNSRHPELDVIRLDLALSRLAGLDPRQGQIVELRYFAGLSIDETAEALGISSATVKREWATARAFLSREVQGQRVNPEGEVPL